jgi:NTE family protein
MTTAFVLTGGGSLGAVQVGMLQALAERGVTPELLVGTSCGALNAAWVAGHGMSSDSLSELAAVWASLRRSDIFPVDARQVLRGLLGLSPAVVTNRKLRQFIDTHTSIHDLAHAKVPTYLVAADLLSGRDVLISTGDVATAVLASSAIPGVLPPVEHSGEQLIDGALARHTGIAQALDLGASVVYILPTGAACALPRAPRTAAGVALHALTLLIEQRLMHELRLCRLRPRSGSSRHCAPLPSLPQTSATPRSSSLGPADPAFDGWTPAVPTSRTLNGSSHSIAIPGSAGASIPLR